MERKKGYVKEFTAALELAREAGDEIMRIYRTGFEAETKADGTAVTIADRRANEIILEGLVKRFPKDGIVSEELGRVDSANNRFWYVDPIDGTSGFVKRRGDFAIHIGLAVDSHPLLGVVYQPVTRDIYYAVKGEGAYHIDACGAELPLAVDAADHGPVAVLEHDARAHDDYIHAITLLGLDSVIQSGSQGLRMMYVARGEANLHFLINHRAGTWDTCAPQAIVEEAGGFVRFIDGSPMTYHGQRSWSGKAFVVAGSEQLLLRTINIFSTVRWEEGHAHGKVK